MKINPRMADLFRATTEVLLITTVIGLAASSSIKEMRSKVPTHLADRNERTQVARPGSGGAAIITLEEPKSSVEVDGRQVQLVEFLQSKEAAERVILRLRGPQWRELTRLIRTRDLQFTVETDP